MREIKFRVWDGKKMSVIGDDYWFEGVTTKRHKDQSITLSTALRNNELIVMQYTGLKDKNGAVYCQNDIVLFDGKNYRLILGTFSFELLGKDAYPGQFFNEGYFAKAEIIGNIHEHGHLLNEN